MKPGSVLVCSRASVHLPHMGPGPQQASRTRVVLVVPGVSVNQEW